MKILWVKSDFLHPTTRGGQIRTLEMLRRLHRRHEVHYVAFDDARQPEGLARAHEYATHVYPVSHSAPDKRSPAFAAQLVQGLFSPLPLAVSRWVSEKMHRKIEEVVRQHRFESIVCDFLVPAPSLGDVLSRAVLFQHNVETLIWRRFADEARGPLGRFYMRLQARRMFQCERTFARRARHVVAVSETDAKRMREMFSLDDVSSVPTGVDLEYFDRPGRENARQFDVVFVGSMDWMPNQDGVRFFLSDVLPRLRNIVPQATVGIVGRQPPPELRILAERAGGVTVTGTVPDVRPYLWGSALSIVPLRIGGGTRLKIYESMAAGTPVVSTSIGAEGLDVQDGNTIRLADAPQAFADACADLLQDNAARTRISQAGRQLVAARFSWDAVTDVFEKILERHPASSG